MSFIDQVRELDPNDPGRWPMSFRFGAIGIIFVLGVVLLGYFLAWKPKKPELDAARAQEQQLLATLEAKARKAANLDAYKAQLAEMEQSFGAMLRKLPNKTEVPNLLTDISQQGTASGLDQKLFQPNAQNIKDFYAELSNRPRGNPEGTVFLVDVKTRQVVWSAFIGEYDRRPKRLHREAKQVVGELRKGMASQ